MTSPHWNKLDILRVSAKAVDLWTPAIEFLPGGRLLRLRVSDKDKSDNPVPKKWRVGGTETGPNGIISGNARTALMCPGAYQGALIAKLGGSTADIGDPTQSAAPFGTRKVFAVGESCVMPVAVADAGPLYLGINDDPTNFANNDGELWVELSEAPI